MDINLLLVLISYVLVGASFISIPLKRKNVMAEVGNPILLFPKKGYGFTIGVQVVAIILITILFFIRYTVFVSIVLCGCGVLGAWIVVGEAALGPKYGLYKNGIVAVGKYIPYSDIITYPVFNLPKKEQLNHPGNVLVIACRKYGNVEITFESDEICSEVVAKLRELGELK